MEDKWFFFAEGETVHLHRSWTGEEIFAFELERLPGGEARLNQVLVNNRYLDDAFAESTLDLLFEKILPHYYD